MRVNDLLSACAKALDGVETVRIAAHQAVSGRVKVDGKIDKTAMDADQFLVHRYAWLATYVDGLRQMLGWAQRLDAAGNLGDLEALILQAGYGEYLNQIAGGIAISQVEIVRPADMGLTDADLKPLSEGAAQHLRAAGNTAAVRDQIAELMANGHFGDLGLGDETLEMIRDQFCRFVEDQVTPHAHAWHLNDDLIPMEVVNQMSDFGVFGVTIPERWSGLGMSKIAMCVVTEELSRGYIGVASLGTRSDIAAELILAGGTEEQKNTYLPKIASGEILPTVVFTEPETGSDLGSLRTRASLVGDVYKVNGNKTWISNGACTDLMTLLVRTKPDETGYKGLSMFLAEKPRSEDPTNPFLAQGMTGGEIEVLGYRGMKEYEIGFDDFEIPRGQLLGGQEGQGFKQLMATFESARVQTAARAIGVAQNALELGLTYALGRTQFGQPIYKFPRISGKLAWMAVETMSARQLCYFAAREKDSDRRCDIEAGMAKLLAARVASSNADNAVQIHGGNGYALEYPIFRVLCDARVLNIFEGTAEIQAQVIARGLLSVEPR